MVPGQRLPVALGGVSPRHLTLGCLHAPSAFCMLPAARLNLAPILPKSEATSRQSGCSVVKRILPQHAARFLGFFEHGAMRWIV